MKAEINCSIVRDMLPLYAENLTSEESNHAIQLHLEQCEDCREYFENIQKPINSPTAPKMEIDYMRKVRRSFKRRTYILAGVITAACIVLLGIFLRIFIIGSPIFVGDAPINYEWSYDANSKIYSIQGDIDQTETGARIKVYEDKQNNQIKIKIYELMPSIFFPTDEFSAKFSWNGETDIVWQGKYDKQVIMNSQYLSLFISEFKDGQYKELVNVFDMDGADMIQQFYNNSAEDSSDDLNSPFAEEQYDNYTIISLPSPSGVYATWDSEDTPLEELSVDDRIFLYQQDGQYYFYKEGQPLKKVSTEDVTIILDYIKQNKTTPKN